MAVCSKAVIVIFPVKALSAVEDAAEEWRRASRTASCAPIYVIISAHNHHRSRASPVGENSRSSPTVLSHACAAADMLLRRNAANVTADLIALLGNDPLLARAHYARNLAPQVASPIIP